MGCAFWSVRRPRPDAKLLGVSTERLEASKRRLEQMRLWADHDRLLAALPREMISLRDSALLQLHSINKPTCWPINNVATHLVENVLSYARVERGRPGGKATKFKVAPLLERVADRLHDQVSRAGMELVVDDTAAVEITVSDSAWR